MRTHHRRPILRKRALPASLNSISAHEQSIASVLESTTDRFESVNARLKQYQKHQNIRSKLSQKQRWINQRRKLELEGVKLSKEIEDVYSCCPDLKNVKGADTDEAPSHLSSSMIDQQVPWKQFHVYLASIRKSSKEVDVTQIHATKKQLEVQNDKLEEECKQIVQELENIRQMMKSVDDVEQNENTTTCLPLPRQVINAIEDVRSEFHQIGIEGDGEIGHALEMKIEEVTSNLSAELSKQQLVVNNKHIQKCTQSDVTWDERDRLILRNAMEEYKNLNMNEKRMMLKSLAKQVKKRPLDVKSELQKMQCERHARTRRKDERHMSSKSRAQIIESASNKIKEIRVAFVERITGELHCLIQDEIAKEREQRIDVLTIMRKCVEERQREEKERMERLESEEIARVTLKRQQDLVAAKDKLSKHMEVKEQEKRVMEVEEWKRQNAENEARMKRLGKNSERVDFRRQERLRKENQNREKVQKLHLAELDKRRKLEALASSVPYFHTINSVKADVLRSTESRRNDIFEPSIESGLENFQMGLSKLTGFTNEKVFSDTKFRLAHQLHEAGVASSAYSCAIVKRLIPRQAERTTGIEPY